MIDYSPRPFRSVLYIPASKERALQKAQGLKADAIIFDLEDAVAPAEKSQARTLLAQTLKQSDYGSRYCIVRVNGADTEWGTADLGAVAEIGPDAVLLPKVEDPAAVAAIAKQLPATRIWAMMETPRGILNAAQIAAAPGMEGFVMGTNDLAKELGAESRAAMTMSLQHCLLAARAKGLVCVDGVFNAFKDEDGLRMECQEGRDWGFDGKTLIHPAQIQAANDVFAPSEAAIELARRQIAAFDEATANGEGVAVVDGKIVENLHVVTAKQVLAMAEAIETLERA